eukprot:scaffold75032_cov36-Phaeocystis_antarctica.AAC.1
MDMDETEEHDEAEAEAPSTLASTLAARQPGVITSHRSYAGRGGAGSHAHGGKPVHGGKPPLVP